MIKSRTLKKKKTIINLKNRISNINDKEEEISKIAFNLNRKLENGLTLTEIPFPKTKFMFDIFLSIFEKPIRNQNDLLIIRHYLNNFDGFLTTLNLKKNFNNPQEILHKISFFLQMEKFNPNFIICKNGDFGDKFYLIFEGSVSILIPIEYQMDLTETEFIYYLKNLLKYKEYDLILKSIRSNPSMKNKFLTEILEFERIANLKENNIHKKSEHVEIDLYINRLIPKSTFGIQSELKTFKLWKYFHVIDLDSGKQFGEIALMDDNKRRTATIITNKFTIFGTIKKEIYVSCIKFSLEMIRKNNIESILKTRLFFGYNHENFENFFFNYFKNNVIFRGDKLFKQNQKRKEIYFIKNGEIKIELYGNCKLLFEIFNNLNDENNKNKENKIKKIFNAIENNYKMKSFYEENKIFNIYIINESDVIGMSDYLFNDNETYFASAKSVSAKSEFFSIELSMFQRLLKEFRIRKNYNEWIQQRRIVMADRIFTIMENSMMHYLNFVKDKNIDNWAKNFDDDNNNKKNNENNKNIENKNENNKNENNKNENKNENNNENNYENNNKNNNKKHKKNHTRNLSLYFNSSCLDHTKYFTKTLTNLPKTFNPKIFYTEENNKENLYLTETQTNSITKTINLNSPSSTEKKTKTIFNYFPKIEKKFPINLKIALKENNNKYKLNFNKGQIINKNLITSLNIYNNVVDKLIENKKILSERNEKKTNLNNIDILALDKYIENLYSERTKNKHFKHLKFKSDYYEYLNNKKNKLYFKSFGKTFYNDGKNNIYFINNNNNNNINEEINEKEIKKNSHKLGKIKNNNYLYE